MTEGAASVASTQAGDRDRLFSKAFLALSAGIALAWFGTYSLNPILPLYVRSLGGADVAVGVIGAAFGLASIGGRLFAGVAVTAFGRRPLLIGGTLLGATTLLLYAVAPTIASLGVVRILHGLAVAIVTTTGLVVAADLAPPKRRGESLGYYATSGNVSQAIAPTVAMLLMGVTWLPLESFSLVFAVGAVAFAAAALLTSATRQQPRRESTGWAWVRNRRLDDFYSVAAIVPALVALGVCFAYGTVLYFLPLATADRGGNVAVYFFVYATSTVLSRPFVGRFSDRLGRVFVAAPSMAVIILGTVLLAIEPSGLTMVVAAAVMGVGVGGTWVLLMTMAVDRVSVEGRAAALATFYVGGDVGMMVGSMVSGVIAEFAGYAAAFGASAFVVALTLASFLIHVRIVGMQKKVG